MFHPATLHCFSFHFQGWRNLISQSICTSLNEWWWSGWISFDLIWLKVLRYSTDANPPLTPTYTFMNCYRFLLLLVVNSLFLILNSLFYTQPWGLFQTCHIHNANMLYSSTSVLYNKTSSYFYTPWFLQRILKFVFIVKSSKTWCHRLNVDKSLPVLCIWMSDF